MAKQNPNINFSNLYYQLPGYFLLKDIESRYLFANENFLKLINMDLENLIGKTDFEMPWHKQFAPKYIQDDKKVINGQILNNYIEQQTRKNGKIMNVLVNKNPLHENNKITGVICHFVDLSAHYLPKISKQQLNCLHLLIAGHTAKEIAKQLNLSYRTVETYILNLKNKLNCKNKAELIRKGILLQNQLIGSTVTDLK